MNKIYKVIWSKVKNSYVVVPEIAVSSSKNKRNKAYKSALVAVLRRCWALAVLSAVRRLQSMMGIH